MNKSRTSTTKKSVKSKNVSKNSASSTGIKVKEVSKTIHSKPSNNKRVTNTRKNVNTLNKNSNIKRKNSHSAQNNIRINKVDRTEYDTIFSEENDVQEILPNNIRKVKPENRNLNKEKKVKRKIKKTTVLKIVFAIAIIVAILYMMFSLEVFNLAKIKVKGNTKYTEDNIISSSSLKLGENIFKQLLFSDNKKVKLPYVSKANYGYIFPNTIVINVKERYPAYIAIDKNTGKEYKIDNDGYLLEECDISQRKDEVLIEGLVFEENVEFGKKINEVYIKKIEIYKNIKELLEKYSIDSDITKVSFSNSLTIITLDDKLKMVFSNDSNLEYKVSFLKGIIQKNGGKVEGTIDMSIENPVYSKYD